MSTDRHIALDHRWTLVLGQFETPRGAEFQWQLDHQCGPGHGILMHPPMMSNCEPIPRCVMCQKLLPPSAFQRMCFWGTYYQVALMPFEEGQAAYYEIHCRIQAVARSHETIVRGIT